MTPVTIQGTLEVLARSINQEAAQQAGKTKIRLMIDQLNLADQQVNLKWKAIMAPKQAVAAPLLDFSPAIQAKMLEAKLGLVKTYFEKQGVPFDSLGMFTYEEIIHLGILSIFSTVYAELEVKFAKNEVKNEINLELATKMISYISFLQEKKWEDKKWRITIKSSFQAILDLLKLSPEKQKPYLSDLSIFFDLSCCRDYLKNRVLPHASHPERAKEFINKMRINLYPFFSSLNSFFILENFRIKLNDLKSANETKRVLNKSECADLHQQFSSKRDFIIRYSANRLNQFHKFSHRFKGDGMAQLADLGRKCYAGIKEYTDDLSNFMRTFNRWTAICEHDVIEDESIYKAYKESLYEHESLAANFFGDLVTELESLQAKDGGSLESFSVLEMMCLLRDYLDDKGSQKIKNLEQWVSKKVKHDHAMILVLLSLFDKAINQYGDKANELFNKNWQNFPWKYKHALNGLKEAYKNEVQHEFLKDFNDLIELVKELKSPLTVTETLIIIFNKKKNYNFFCLNQNFDQITKDYLKAKGPHEKVKKRNKILRGDVEDIINVSKLVALFCWDFPLLLSKCDLKQTDESSDLMWQELMDEEETLQHNANRIEVIDDDEKKEEINNNQQAQRHEEPQLKVHKIIKQQEGRQIEKQPMTPFKTKESQWLASAAQGKSSMAHRLGSIDGTLLEQTRSNTHFYFNTLSAIHEMVGQVDSPLSSIIKRQFYFFGILAHEQSAKGMIYQKKPDQLIATHHLPTLFSQVNAKANHWSRCLPRGTAILRYPYHHVFPNNQDMAVESLSIDSLTQDLISLLPKQNGEIPFISKAGQEIQLNGDLKQQCEVAIIELKEALKCISSYKQKMGNGLTPKIEKYLNNIEYHVEHLASVFEIFVHFPQRRNLFSVAFWGLISANYAIQNMGVVLSFQNPLGDYYTHSIREYHDFYQLGAQLSPRDKKFLFAIDIGKGLEYPFSRRFDTLQVVKDLYEHLLDEVNGNSSEEHTGMLHADVMEFLTSLRKVTQSIVISHLK